MHRNIFLAILALHVCLHTTSLFAQTSSLKRYHNPRSSKRDVRPRRATPNQFLPQPTEEPYQLRPGYYVYPAPYSPDYWSPRILRYDDYSQYRRGYRQGHRRSGRDYQRYGYYRGLHDPYYGYGYSRYPRELYRAYEQGRYDADHEYLWYIASARAGRLLNQHREMFDQALISFRDGRYDWAAIKLIGAAEKNHSSAASRLHAGHALFALGRYEEATALIARAFELAPSLPHKKFDIRDEYGNKADFNLHLKALKSYVTAHAHEPGAVTLLGYVTYYTEGPGAAYPYFRRAARLNPKSYFIPKLLKLARFTSGAVKQAAPQDRYRSPLETSSPGYNDRLRFQQVRAGSNN